MVIADHPLHGSRRAALRHRALALRHDPKQHRRPWVHDSSSRDVAVSQPLHSLPFFFCFLAASPEGSMPQSVHFLPEPLDGPCIPSDAVVLAVSAYHGSQPLAYLGYRVVPTSPQLLFDLFELGSLAIAYRVPSHREPASSPGPPTAVHKHQKLEGLRLPLPTPPPILCGVPPKLQQARLVRVQLQPKLLQSLPQDFQKTLGIRLGLEPNDEIVQIPHDDHLTLRLCRPPSLCPQVEHVVQVHVGQQRRDTPALLGADLTARPRPVFQHARG